jgi:hypothetical protein
MVSGVENGAVKFAFRRAVYHDIFSTNMNGAPIDIIYSKPLRRQFPYSTGLTVFPHRTLEAPPFY